MAGQFKRQDARALYQHAWYFLMTDRQLRVDVEKDRGLEGVFQFPAMVISAFASELFLKCLLVVENKEPPRNVHNLAKLFGLLEQARQGRIQTLWDKSVHH